MKTYTLTWLSPDSFYLPKGLWKFHRCCFCVGAFYWISATDTAVGNFCRLLKIFDLDQNLRLTKCGKLVARSATYQGV